MSSVAVHWPPSLSGFWFWRRASEMEIHRSNGSSPLVLAPLWLGQKHDMYWLSAPNFFPCGGTPYIQPKLMDVIMAGKGRYLVVVYPILTTARLCVECMTRTLSPPSNPPQSHAAPSCQSGAPLSYSQSSLRENRRRRKDKGKTSLPCGRVSSSTSTPCPRHSPPGVDAPSL